MQNSNGYIFKLPSGTIRFVGDDDVVYDWILRRWRRAYVLPASCYVADRMTMLGSLRATRRPFYRARMIR